MLINFTFENFMSFRDKTHFTMLASREQQHSERLSRNKKYRMRTLPVAAIYGGNASGKSNFVKALGWAKYFITTAPSPDGQIYTRPFRLDNEIKKLPSKFIFEILINNTMYEFFFSVSSTEVKEEKLIEISSSSEKTLYHRKNGSITFHSSIENDRLHFIFEGTKNNQLFLNNSVDQQINTFQSVFEWFSTHLNILDPKTHFNYELYPPTNEMNRTIVSGVEELLKGLDTGISQFSFENYPLENLQLSEEEILMYKEKTTNTRSAIVGSKTGEKILLMQLNNNLIAYRHSTFHSDSSGEQVRFGLNNESDGTQRILDILPAIFLLRDLRDTKVFIIDELDRSLHSHITRKLIKLYLSKCNESSTNQLIFTTHDNQLMDQNFLRRDEMWIIDRYNDGRSEIKSLGDFVDIHKDKDIRKSYLQGRFGGIPNILLGDYDE